MKNYFYAYHSSRNTNKFDCNSGYGVSESYKYDKVKIGDLVFIIQNIKNKNTYELCGLYEVTDKNYVKESRLPYRMELKDTSKLPLFIKLNEHELSEQLPTLDYKYKWSNFKKHFCRQSASFQKPLDEDVVKILQSKIDTIS